MFKGEFVFINPISGDEGVLCNTVLENGQQRFMEAIFQQATKSIVTFQLGLFDEIPAYTADVADITTEPTAAGGYARQNLVSDITDWPIVGLQNGMGYAESKTLTFTASGADYSRAFSRAFLMESGGEILAYSSPLQSPKLLLDTDSFQIKYRIFNQ